MSVIIDLFQVIPVCVLYIMLKKICYVRERLSTLLMHEVPFVKCTNVLLNVSWNLNSIVPRFLWTLLSFWEIKMWWLYLRARAHKCSEGQKADRVCSCNVADASGRTGYSLSPPPSSTPSFLVLLPSSCRFRLQPPHSFYKWMCRSTGKSRLPPSLGYRD